MRAPANRLSLATEWNMADLVDDSLSPVRLQSIAHGEDWPEPMASAPSAAATGLPRGIWDAAIGDVARDILSRPSRQFRARMCELAWRLAQDPADISADMPAHLPAIVEIVHAGSLIVDDIEDGSLERRGAPALHVIHGMPRTLNTGNWMYFWAMELVDQLMLREAKQHQLRRALGDGMYRCHLGQALDLSIAVGELPQTRVYRAVATTTMLKTGALMELAARLGAVAADAADTRVEALARFGRRMGLGLQMLDDFGNLNAPGAEEHDSKSLEDLRNGRPTWPWAHAATELDAPTFEALQARLGAVTGGSDSDGTRARALAAELRMAVGRTGRTQSAAYLQRALRDLRAEVGPREELALLGREIERLEASYG